MEVVLHKMKLRSPYFEKIADGSKYVELRLNDEKRQLINIGDEIEFSRANGEAATVNAKVVGLLRYANFRDLLNDFSLESVGAEDAESFLEILNSFYSDEEQAKYGVLGIRISLVSQ